MKVLCLAGIALLVVVAPATPAETETERPAHQEKCVAVRLGTHDCAAQSRVRNDGR